MKTRKLTVLAMLTALALIIFIVEAQLPPLAPVPGIKMGLANIITLITLVWFGRKEAFTVLMLRIIMGSIFAGQMMSLIYSLAGGILCFVVMSLLIAPLKDKLWVVSVFGAAAHNIGQIIIAVLITSTWQIAAYLPLLIISAVVTGAFTGAISTFISKRKDLIQAWSKEK